MVSDKFTNLSFLILFICLNVINIAFGQNLPVRFGHVSESEGLLDNNTNVFITEDRRGFVWISSKQGPYRFDGERATYYSIEGAGKSDVNIQSEFFEDKEDNMWFTAEHHLHVYNRKKDKIESRNINSESGLHAFFLETENNHIWIADTGKSIFKIDLKDSNKKHKRQPTKGMRFTVDTLSSGQPDKIFSFPWRLSTGFEIISLSKDTTLTESVKSGVIGDAYIRSGILGRKGVIFLISNLGLIEYDYLKKKIIRNHNLVGKQSTHFKCGVKISESKIALVSRDSGLWIFDTIDKSFSEYKPEGIPDKGTVQNISCSKENEVYLSYKNDGIGYSIKLNSSFYNPLKEEGSLSVTGIVEDDQCRIWVTTKQAGVFVFDSEMNKLRQFTSVVGRTNFSGAHLSKDQFGNIWLSLNTEVFRLRLSEPLNQSDWEQIIKVPGQIFNIHHDTSNNLLIGGFNGFWTYNSKSQKLSTTNIQYLEEDKFTGGYTFHSKIPNTVGIVPVSKKGIRIALFDDNVLQIEKKLLDNTAAIDCIETQSGDYGIGTYEGLLITRKGDKDFINLAPDDTDFFSLIEDVKGRIWGGTNRGLYLKEKGTDNFSFFTEKDGLSSNEYFRAARVYASDGKIWLGNNEGLTVFHPDSIKTPDVAIKVYFDKLWINGIPKSEFAINEAKRLDLDYLETTIEIKVNTIGISKEEKKVTEYRLIGYEKEWQRLKSGNIIRYTNLPAGDYNLEVRTINGNNIFSKLKGLEIKIPLPFWKTTWFILSCFVLVGIIVSGFVSLYYRRLIAEKEREIREERIVNFERERIAKELHDDIGGSLSSILFLSEDLLFDVQESNQTKPISRISELSRDTLSNMKEIVWALDKEQSTLGDLIEKVKNHANLFLLERRIQVEFDKRISSPEIEISSEIKRNLYLTIKEVLNNIAKHSEADRVKILLQEQEGTLQITISDNGKGFEFSNIKKGNGLDNITHRIAKSEGSLNINSENQQGTQVEIIIPL